LDEQEDPYRTASHGPGIAERTPPVGAGASHSPEEKAPESFGRYKVARLLGKGGFGEVYLSRDEQLKRDVAIKVPRRELLDSRETVASYLAEARTLASLDHPNIVPVYDVGTTEDGLCFVVSKFIEGTDLATRIRRQRLTFAESAELTATIAQALHHAHRQGLVHRDVKPANILIDSAGRVYLADFGLALSEEDAGKDQGFCGTPLYMSPEQALGESHRVEGRSDVFSLGVVFYELLTGRLPFRAEAVSDILDRIVNSEVRPPRQIDDAIPKELERICLKSLSKRVGERYTTAKDLAEDLRLFLAEGQDFPRPISVLNSNGISAETPRPFQTQQALTPQSNTPRSFAPISERIIHVVPKGLRSFDGGDADFFLELLPGPRDRDGLPDSVRFWKTRVEQTDAEQTFAVGLVYGPSGCGKSSLMKAGLLPRLAKHVVPIYVEATPKDTEARLLRGLRKHFPECMARDDSTGLASALATLRKRRSLLEGKKVLIVIDQLEQWLHAHPREENVELVKALRQCDGEHVQCILMVRDDFWMAATRFLEQLEINLVQGQNCAAVDLFDMRHSKKVLTAFGQAYHALPDRHADLVQDQVAFVDQAVSGLAEDGTIIPIRLTLFAEMVKGKPWSLATLHEVGGMQGVGVAFLDETFSSRSAEPKRRLHQLAAQSVLKALLPEVGSDIKGNMRSYREILVASGYADRPKDFEELLHILDGELRLITPTERAGENSVVSAQAPAVSDPKRDSVSSLTTDHLPLTTHPSLTTDRYYQLTHDYLVPSLREWLTRKQKETRRGRALSRLVERSAVWNASPINRHLPTWWEWVDISLLTRKQDRTASQQKMMRQATRQHVLGTFVVALILILAGWGTYELAGGIKARALQNRLLDADIAVVPDLVHEMAPYRRWLDSLLVESIQAAKTAGDSRQHLHLSLALLPVDSGQRDFLAERLVEASPSELPVLRDALAPHKEALLSKLWDVAENPPRHAEGQRLRAAAALAGYDPDSPRWTNVREQVAADLVAINPVFLGTWIEAFRPVKPRLIGPLAEIFRDNGPKRSAERVLATILLADYAADQPQLLTDLLMDANERQFRILFPKLNRNKELILGLLENELDKKPPPFVFETHGTINRNDANVKIFDVPEATSPLPAKRFSVALKKRHSYTISMASSELDACLVLQDAAGKQLAFDIDSAGDLNARVDFTAANDESYQIYAASFKGLGSFSLAVFESEADERLIRRQSNAAVALLKLEQAARVWPLLRSGPDPRLRSYLIHHFGPMEVGAGVLVHHASKETDVTIRRALLLSLGEFSAKDFSATEFDALREKLRATCSTAGDPGLHAAAEWLLRHWNDEAWLKEQTHLWAKERKSSRAGRSPWWYVTDEGHTMVVIPPVPSFLMGSPAAETGRINEQQHLKKISRTFAIASKHVTMGQFLRFRNDDEHLLLKRYAPTEDCPVNGTTWYEAAAYCNWLSRKEGIDESQWCYESDEAGNVIGLKQKYLSLTGYRLPTEAEMEYACRAGTSTSRYYGDSTELLGKYGWYVQNSNERTWPTGSLKPNDLGLFDMHGNVWSWCQEVQRRYPKTNDGNAMEDVEDVLTIDEKDFRAVRGGSFTSRPSEMRSAHRYAVTPGNRLDLVGIRPARTMPANGKP
jgi:serine/threonine protein kinase/formylglycine-generating enzyme required for sulfatase activity